MITNTWSTYEHLKCWNIQTPTEKQKDTPILNSSTLILIFSLWFKGKRGFAESAFWGFAVYTFTQFKAENQHSTVSKLLFSSNTRDKKKLTRCTILQEILLITQKIYYKRKIILIENKHSGGLKKVFQIRHIYIGFVV